MRIVGGRFGGRILQSPKSDKTRPTTDRTRESLFNILVNKIDLEGAYVLDLFAGTGALGLEALSRGAEFVCFVEQDRQAAKIVRENIIQLNVESKTELIVRDATKLPMVQSEKQFDLVFADPPYGKELGEKTAGSLVQNNWLKNDALFVLEERADVMPHDLEGFDLKDIRNFGDTAIGIFTFNFN